MIYLTEARRHLRIDGTQDDAEIEQKLLVAKTLVVAYIGYQYGDYEDLVDLSYELVHADPQSPAARRLRHIETLDAAILLVLGDLWQNRESGSGNPLSASVVNLLNLFREPTYA
ncbi:head-tail connector protein [Candidatus Accumulibacter sp. ACC007]|uniref:head-tail connector protein n=1 Tax=Candidatus Accumulibacter sp. ACC007 TaxID=2823333 RepID=UPI0025C50C98|nr:head-tail connector protein [Candidatus Accumulibacter sp. ACC007]